MRLRRTTEHENKGLNLYCEYKELIPYFTTVGLTDIEADGLLCRSSAGPALSPNTRIQFRLSSQ